METSDQSGRLQGWWGWAIGGEICRGKSSIGRRDREGTVVGEEDGMVVVFDTSERGARQTMICDPFVNRRTQREAVAVGLDSVHTLALGLYCIFFTNCALRLTTAFAPRRASPGACLCTCLHGMWFMI